MNVVHTLNVVHSPPPHLRVVPDDRRERTREAKRRRILEAAQAVLERDGLPGITMQAVADQLDCAVGTLYTAFPSKAALLVSLRAQAVDLLRASFATARPSWEEALADDDLPPRLGALTLLAGFGGFWAAASVVWADEFTLQRELLSEPVGLLGAGAVKEVMPLLHRLLDQPTSLLAEAEAVGALDRGDTTERALTWIAALNGVLLLDHLAPVDRHLFRATHLVRRLTEDLLVGWGAERGEAEVATSHVERLAVQGPLAPPPDVPPSR
jgi:AcrR family transcriptional regulator